MIAEVFIPLTKGFGTVVDFDDFDDFEIVRPFKWHAELLESKKGDDVDHTNRDTLDNHRSNLRICTRSQNCGNQKIRSTNRSGFKGVNWKKPGGKKNPYGHWCARISVESKRIQLGYFSTAEEAARVYDQAAQKYFGEFARLNFPNKKAGVGCK